MLGIEERDSVVAAEVEGFVPCRPKDIVQRAIYAGMTFKTAKGIADIPDDRSRVCRNRDSSRKSGYESLRDFPIHRCVPAVFL